MFEEEGHEMPFESQLFAEDVTDDAGGAIIMAREIPIYAMGLGCLS